MKKIAIKSYFLIFTALIISISSSFPASAAEPLVKTDQYFKDANIQIMTVECDETTASSPSAVNTLTGGNNSPGSSEGCGEQGYEAGGRVSQANKDQIWSYTKTMELDGKKLTDEQAVGIMGNFDKETGGTFMPDAVNSIGCIGVAQWCYDRADALKTWAEANGKGGKPGEKWKCLQTQLDYMHYEMTQTSERQVVAPLLAASSAAEAANVFHDYYERSNTATGEHLGRDTRAEKLLTEYTGKTPSSSPSGGSGSQSEESSGACRQAGATNKQAEKVIPSADCEALKQEITNLTNSKKIIQDEQRQANDFKNCTTTDIPCGTVEGKGQSTVNPAGGGVHPNILRVAAAVADVGEGPLVLWSFNSGHECDELNHPHGKAVDIPCGDSGQGAYTDMKKCQEIIDYILEDGNKEKLGITELLWQTGYRCGDGVNCTVGGHGDHIHIGVRG